MGLVHANIELVNTFEEQAAERGMIQPEEVNRMRVNALVDSGAFMFCINELIKSQLRLPAIGKQTAQMANGHIEEYEIVGPVTIYFENRQTICRAIVLPGNNEVLLGAIPMEDMDVLINPRSQQLVVNPEHPNFAQTILK